MAKVTILGRGLGAEELERLQALLNETNECEGSVDVVAEIGNAAPGDDDAVVILLGTPATCADADLEDDLAHAQMNAQRVIWIWPKDSAESDHPPAAKKYCYSILPWNLQKLRVVLADDDVTCFEAGDGRAIDKVETERNICVEEEKVRAGTK